MTQIGFLLLYVLGMVPTYILPYFGSNSFIAQAAMATLSSSSFGLSWTFLHAGALALCVLVAWARGRVNGKTVLVALPIVASVFDLTPVLSSIPLVPTVMHVIALVMGFAPDVEVDESKVPDGRLITLIAAAIVGLSFTAAVANWGFATSKAGRSSAPALTTSKARTGEGAFQARTGLNDTPPLPAALSKQNSLPGSVTLTTPPAALLSPGTAQVSTPPAPPLSATVPSSAVALQPIAPPPVPEEAARKEAERVRAEVAAKEARQIELQYWNGGQAEGEVRTIVDSFMRGIAQQSAHLAEESLPGTGSVTPLISQASRNYQSYGGAKSLTCGNFGASQRRNPRWVQGSNIAENIWLATITCTLMYPGERPVSYGASLVKDAQGKFVVFYGG